MTTPLSPSLPLDTDILTLGAGLTGSWLAAHLHAAGQRVAVLDKARGPGGRLSVRRTDRAHFAHGCPASAALDWLRTLDGARRSDLGLEPSTRDLPAGIPRQLLRGVPSRFGAQVARIERHGGRWEALDGEGRRLAMADRLVLTAPAPQAAALLGTLQPAWATRLSGLHVRPRWSLLLAQPAGLTEPEWTRLGDALDYVRQQVSPIAECADSAWVLQMSDAFTRQRLESEPAGVLQEVITVLDVPPARFSHAAAHRWRYAQVTDPLSEPMFLDADTGLAVCGDAFAAGSHGSDLQRCQASAEALLATWVRQTR